jgi:hypothetical protein
LFNSLLQKAFKGELNWEKIIILREI